MESSAALPKNIRYYEIAELVSREGSLRIYRAFDSKNQRSVTLKTVPLDHGDRDVTALIAQFKTQAKVLSGVRHPGIVEVYEYGEDEGVAYLALEFAEGCFLKPRLRLPIVDAGSAIMQLLQALQAAHQQSVVHLGIHPGCLLLTSKGQVRVTDFGAGSIQAGPLAYSAPERLSGDRVDARADIFSAGAWFYELLTGVSAFGDSPDGLMDRICHERERSPSEVNHSIPDVFDSVCATALAKAPADRFTSAREFADSVRRAFESAFGATPKELLSNETVVSVFLSTLRGPRPTRSKQPAPAVPAQADVSRGPSSNTVWSDQALRTVEKQLARHIGPVARVVVKNAAARSRNVEDLYQIAAESLGSDQERRAFLEGHISDAAMREAISAPQVQPGSEEPTVGNHDPVRPPRGMDDPVKAARHVIPSPAKPVGPAPAPIPHESVERKPKPVAAAQSSSEDPDQQVVKRLEALLGKQPESLAGYLAEESPEVDQVIYGFISATEALLSLYASGGKTGGLAPQNIRFDRLGKASVQAAPPASTSLQGATSFGSLGSPRYAAPEMFKETSTGSSAPAALPDIYAMGFMFYEILLGRKLFSQTFSSQRSDLDWLRWHSDSKSEAPTLKSVLPGRPVALSDLLQSMMKKEPGARPSDLKDIATRLRSIAQQSSRTVVARKASASGDVKPAPPQSSRRPWIIAAILALILLLGGLLYWQIPTLRQWIGPSASQPADAPNQN